VNVDFTLILFSLFYYQLTVGFIDVARRRPQSMLRITVHVPDLEWLVKFIELLGEEGIEQVGEVAIEKVYLALPKGGND
jgi:hypothetical protein